MCFDAVVLHSPQNSQSRNRITCGFPVHEKPKIAYVHIHNTHKRPMYPLLGKIKVLRIFLSAVLAKVQNAINSLWNIYMVIYDWSEELPLPISRSLCSTRKEGAEAPVMTGPNSNAKFKFHL